LKAASLDTPNQAVDEAKARLVRVAVWGQVIGFLLFGMNLLAEDVPTFMRVFGLPSLAWPIAFLVALYAIGMDVLIARAMGRALLSFFVVLVSLTSVIATIAGAWGLRDLSEYYRTDGDLLDMNSLLTIGGFYLGALLVNLIMIGRMYRVRADERNESAG